MSFMPQLALWNAEGERVGEIEADEAIFNAPLNRDLIHQAVVVADSQRLRKCGRAKTRDLVAVTGAKMYRQKGLGRARHGDQGAPLFVGGGVAHPPKGDGRMRVMPKKARQQAMYAALSSLARRGNVLVLEKLALPASRTKNMVALLETLRAHGKVLMLVSPDEARDESNYKSSRNLPRLVLRESPHINTRDVLWADHVIFTQGGLQVFSGGGGADA
jgi:large subunit ribosomal protein L4